MTAERFILTYLLVHGILCLLIWLGLVLGILGFSRQMMPIVVLVPVVGVITAVVAQIICSFGSNGSRDITLEDPHLASGDLRLQQFDREGTSDVIPVQEALRINDASTRRKLILEILRQDPREYVQQLQEACADSDLEVSHYASTALMEIRREFELSTQQAEAAYQEAPNAAGNLEKAISCMRRYIASGLIHESILPAYCSRLADLLRVRMRRQPEDMECRLDAVDNFLTLGNLTEARILAEELVCRWPNREQPWLKKLKVCYEARDSQGLSETLAQIEERNIYLSPEGRNTLLFWRMGKEENGL